MHWHKVNKRGKTLAMSVNPFRILLWLLTGRVRTCRLPYSWFDRKAGKWRGSGYNPDGICVNAN